MHEVRPFLPVRRAYVDVPRAGPRREMPAVTLSYDHDVVDGAPAARFSARPAELLEAGHGLAGSAEERSAGEGSADGGGP